MKTIIPYNSDIVNNDQTFALGALMLGEYLFIKPEIFDSE